MSLERKPETRRQLPLSEQHEIVVRDDVGPARNKRKRRKGRQRAWEDKPADKMAALKLMAAFLLPLLALFIWASMGMGG